jgi:hypothetical protein
VEVDDDSKRQQHGVAKRALLNLQELVEQRRQRLGGGNLLQGQDRRLGNDGIGNQAEEGGDRHRISDGAQCVDRRELEPEVALEQLDQGRNGFPVTELTQRLDGRLRHVGVRMPDEGNDPVYRQWVADPGQHLEGKHDDVRIGAAQQGPQVRNRVRTLALQRADRRIAPDGVRLVGNQLTQNVGLDVARREPDSFLSYHGGRIFQGRENRALPLRALRQPVQRLQPLCVLVDRSHRRIRPGTLRPAA